MRMMWNKMRNTLDTCVGCAPVASVALRVSIGLVQGILLSLLYSMSVRDGGMAALPWLPFACFLCCLILPVIVVVGLDQLSARSLLLWSLIVIALLSVMAGNEVWRHGALGPVPAGEHRTTPGPGVAFPGPPWVLAA